MIAPALIVLDLAGTTVYDRGEVPAAFSEVLQAAGIPFDAAEVPSWRGAAKREVLSRLLARQASGAIPTAERLDDLYGRFRAALVDRFALRPELSLPGVRSALGRLRGAGIRLALTSGFDRHIVQTILARVDWADLVDAWVCSEDVAQGRPAPFMIFRAMECTGVRDVRRVAIVGDTLLDLEAGWNAGAGYRIGVLTGAHDRATLQEGRPTHLMESLTQVAALWLSGPS